MVTLQTAVEGQPPKVGQHHAPGNVTMMTVGVINNQQPWLGPKAENGDTRPDSCLERP